MLWAERADFAGRRKNRTEEEVMRNFLKKRIIVFVTVFLILLAAGCGKKDTQSGAGSSDYAHSGQNDITDPENTDYKTESGAEVDAEELEVKKGKANGIDAQTLYLVPSGFFSDKDEEEEDSEEAASFVPENIRITCSYGSKNLKATVTVLTSDDVARLEIDGNVVEPKTMKGKNKYTYSQKNVTAGTIYSIVAYDEAGTASETYTVVAE